MPTSCARWKRRAKLVKRRIKKQLALQAAGRGANQLGESKQTCAAEQAHTEALAQQATRLMCERGRAGAAVAGSG